MALNGRLKKLQPVDSTDTLFSDGEGYIQQWSGGYYHLLVHPGSTGHLGHMFQFKF